MGHEQMFKDLPSSKRPVMVERIMLGLETWASGSILTEGNILLLDFLFSRIETSDSNIGIIANVVCL